MLSNNNLLINISGPSGSGKTSLANELGTRLQETTVINSDNYYISDNTYPKRLKIWMDEGSDFKEWNCPRLIEDLNKLKSGKIAEDPLTKEAIIPREILILDNGFGRILYSLEDLVDYAVHIEIPYENALVRYIERTFYLEKAANISTPKFAEELSEFLNLYITEDFSGFNNYIFKNASEKYDLLVNGMDSIAVSANKIIEQLGIKFPNKVLPSKN